MAQPRSNEHPELREYLIGGLTLLASPKDLISLSIRRKKNPELNRLLKRFANPKKRTKLLEESWRGFDMQVEYRYKNKGSPYFTVFGTRGLGKSEVAAFFMERCRAIYESVFGQKPVPAFGRNPTDMNELLARATQMKRTAVVIGDETENELAQGKNTEENALLDNLETLRILQHTLIRCANRYARLKTFSLYCDFVFEVIYSDRVNRVNYCIMYVVDEEISPSDPRVPIGILNVPLHANQALREIYEREKLREQTEFTSGGGRRSQLRSKLQPTIDSVVAFCKERGLSVGRGKDITTAAGLLQLMVFEEDILSGDKWNTGEQELICQRAFYLLSKGEGKHGQTTPGGSVPAPVEPTAPSYEGQTEDLRTAVIAQLLKRGNDPEKVKAFEIYVTRKISQDNVSLALKAEGVTASQPTVHSWCRDLAGTEEFFEATELGFAYEDVFSARLTTRGVKHIKQGGNSPQPDIIVFNDDGNSFREVISLKCFVQRRNSYTITRDKIGSREVEFAKAHGIPCHLIFFDIWHNIEYDPVLVTEEQNTYNFHA